MHLRSDLHSRRHRAEGERRKGARESRRMSSWFLRGDRRRGRNNREDPATAAATTQQRRRRNLLSSYPQPFSIQIEAAKKAQGTHTRTCVRVRVSARTHTRKKAGPPAPHAYPSVSPSVFLSRPIARFRPRRARECRFYRSVNITVTNTGSGEGHPPAASSSAHACIGIMHRERGFRLCVGRRTGLTRCECLFFLLSFPRLARSNPRTNARFVQTHKNYRACFCNPDRPAD